MIIPGSGRRIYNIGTQHGISVAGLMADCRQLALRAREEASQWRSLYGSIIPTSLLAERVASYVHVFTLYGALRPFGSAIILAGWDDANGYQLFSIDPSGTCFGYMGVAQGKAASAARNEIEKLNLGDMTAVQAVNAMAKAIYRVHDAVKDKEFELEMSWITDANGHKFERVPQDVFAAANTAAQQVANEDFDDSE